MSGTPPTGPGWIRMPSPGSRSPQTKQPGKGWSSIPTNFSAATAARSSETNGGGAGTSSTRLASTSGSSPWNSVTRPSSRSGRSGVSSGVGARNVTSTVFPDGR
nr:hypothetical protein GCM10020093_025480 [Planobispora longispora]